MNKLALFSVPRSGSSWLGEILNSSPQVIYKFQPNFAYSFDAELKNDSTKKEINLFFEKLLKCDDDFVNGKLSISGKKSVLDFKKENQNTLLFKETHYINIVGNILNKTDIKIIGLLRSPFAVINSWINIPKEFDPSWDLKEEWVEANKKNEGKATHFFGYKKWKEVCFMFLKFREKYPKQFYLINYDDLIKNTEYEVKRLFEFCNLEFTEQTDLFINQSRSNSDGDAYSVFRQKRDDLEWKKKLPDFIHKEIKNDPEFIKLNKIYQWTL